MSGTRSGCVPGMLGVGQRDPAAPAPGRVVPVAPGGVDLFRMALVAYGDALAWTAIARANGLWDPWPAPEATPPAIRLPRAPDAALDSGGVLGAP